MDVYECSVCKMGSPGTLDWTQSNYTGPYWRIYWNDAGGAFVKVAGQELELGPGKIAVLTPNTVYSTRTVSGSRHFYVHFSVEKPYADMAPKLYALTDRRLLALAKSLMWQLDFESSLSTKTLLKVRIYLCEALLTLPSGDIPDEKSLDARIARSLELLAAHPKLSNHKLAAALGMSHTSFCSLFLREMGKSPQAYSRRARLDQACVMLHFGDKPIKQVAADVGFYDRYHFSRSFRAEFGLSPARFRKQAVAFQRMKAE